MDAVYQLFISSSTVFNKPLKIFRKVDFVSVPLTVRTAVEEFRDDAALNVDAMVTTLRGTMVSRLQLESAAMRI